MAALHAYYTYNYKNISMYTAYISMDSIKTSGYYAIINIIGNINNYKFYIDMCYKLNVYYNIIIIILCNIIIIMSVCVYIPPVYIYIII